MRDEFTEATKSLLAKRVASRCSNPQCQKVTTGPQQDSAGVVNLGVAAHVTAAALGGPRYDPNLTLEERRSSDNGIWLCQTCGKLVDSDEPRFTVAVLRRWKHESEEAAAKALEQAPAVCATVPPTEPAEKIHEHGSHDEIDVLRVLASRYPNGTFGHSIQEEASQLNQLGLRTAIHALIAAGEIERYDVLHPGHSHAAFRLTAQGMDRARREGLGHVDDTARRPTNR